jgi:hypothetical protein
MCGPIGNRLKNMPDMGWRLLYPLPRGVIAQTT